MKLQRPLSPHLTVYSPQRGSVLSISMRISGVILFLPFLYGGLAPLFLSTGWATLPNVLQSSLNPLLFGLESLRESTSLQTLSSSFDLSTQGSLVCGTFFVFLLWTLCVYHCIHPLVDSLMEDWYLNTPYQFSPDFWKTQYILCVGLFLFGLGLGIGTWLDFLLELSDAYADYAGCMVQDDLGPAFDRKSH